MAGDMTVARDPAIDSTTRDPTTAEDSTLARDPTITRNTVDPTVMDQPTDLTSYANTHSSTVERWWGTQVAGLTPAVSRAL